MTGPDQISSKSLSRELAEPCGGQIDAPFWGALADGRLEMQRCSQCEKVAWPPQWRCGACGSWSMRWDAVPMQGVVHSLAVTHHAFVPEMVGKTPYVSVLVTLTEADGARLLGKLEGNEASVAIGARVIGRIEIDPAHDSFPTIRWALETDR